MVGEIRDAETARSRSSRPSPGHLVLSTLHTNDAPGAISRLTEMGIEPFLTASAVDCVISQRLARVLCTNCKERVMLAADALRKSGFEVRLRHRGLRASWLPALQVHGLQGPHRPLRGDGDDQRAARAGDRACLRGRDPRVAVEQGMQLLAQDGFAKVRAGITSIEEVARVTGSARACRLRTTDDESQRKRQQWN